MLEPVCYTSFSFPPTLSDQNEVEIFYSHVLIRFSENLFHHRDFPRHKKVKTRVTIKLFILFNVSVLLCRFSIFAFATMFIAFYGDVLTVERRFFCCVSKKHLLFEGSRKKFESKSFFLS